MIFGHVEALGFLYFLTRFLTLNLSGKREHEGKTFLLNIYKSFAGDLNFGFQTFAAGSREEI